MKKPTIKELEKILDEPAETIVIMPNGEVRTALGQPIYTPKPVILTLDKALRGSTY